MEFLKKYYEKVVLGVLLLGFLLALIYLLQMTGSARQVTVKDLEFEAPTTKYESTDFKSADFDFDAIFAGKADWSKRSGAEVEGAGAELVVPMKALRCSVCQKIVPLALVKKDLKCPICGEKLENPPDVAQINAIDQGGRDTDRDGMPDSYEKKMGFNPQQPSDASEDADFDGFSNLYEFLMGTDPLNPKSYPGLEKRIYLAKLVKQALPVKLNGVSVIPDPADKNSKRFWDISLELNKQPTSVTIGQEIMVGKHKYKVADAEYRVEDQLATSVVLDNDKSRVTLEPLDEGGEKLVLEVGKKVYSAYHRAIIEDIATGKIYRVSVGDTFTVGDAEGAQAVFQVKSTDGDKDHVTLINQDTGAEVLMTRDIKIPASARVGGGRMGGMGGMPGDMMPPAMDTPRRGNQQRRNASPMAPRGASPRRR